MTESTIAGSAGPELVELRSERRRLVQAVAAHRRLLAARPAFERADLRRLNREVRERTRAQQRHDAALRRADGTDRRAQDSCTRRLAALDGSRETREAQALVALRRQFVEREVAKSPLTAQEVNGVGEGLVRDLAAQGIRTASDFTGVSYAKAANGRGGTVVWIHRTQGGRVHVNGIGEHRAKTLVEWRNATVGRAEDRAPKALPPDERFRLDGIIAEERLHLRQEREQAAREAEAARAEAGRLLAETAARLTGTESEGAASAALRRAEFDGMAEQLLRLQDELRRHMDDFADLRTGFRLRRAQERVLRPVPQGPFVPPQRGPGGSGAGAPGPGAPGPGGAVWSSGTVHAAGGALGQRARLLWLVPLLWFALTAVVGLGLRAAGPLWAEVLVRVVALAALGQLLRLWVPRRRAATARAMPAGSALCTWGVFWALGAFREFVGAGGLGSGLGWCWAALSALLLVMALGRSAEA
ncbi:hypothetical protein ACIA8O_22605 [Kitasatospora sp. NPDC051853]|uniref:hypothetical protein n=1 Tax=Kitasatospora sp. NPDC051853 TaxID=3364058 RepID=UPI00379BD0B1